MTREEDRELALASLFEHEYPALRRLAFLLLGDSAAAEEVVMDVFARVLSRWTMFRDVEGPVPYLRRAVVNQCRSRGRRLAVERRFALKERLRDERDASSLDDRGEALDVWRAVRSLPDVQRACIVLRYVEDLSLAQIAEVLDIPLGTVKSHLTRARARLSETLGPDLEVHADGPG